MIHFILQLPSFDSEDVQSSNDEFHDAMEAVEEEGVGVVEDFPVTTSASAGRGDAKINVESLDHVDVKERPGTVKQEPAILCSLANNVGKEVWGMLV